VTLRRPHALPRRTNDLLMYPGTPTLPSPPDAAEFHVIIGPGSRISVTVPVWSYPRNSDAVHSISSPPLRFAYLFIYHARVNTRLTDTLWAAPRFCCEQTRGSGAQRDFIFRQFRSFGYFDLSFGA